MNVSGWPTVTGSIHEDFPWNSSPAFCPQLPALAATSSCVAVAPTDASRCRWTGGLQLTRCLLSTYPHGHPCVTCQRSMMRQPRVKCAGLALGLLLILYLQHQEHPSSTKAETVTTEEIPTRLSELRLQNGTDWNTEGQRSAFVPYSPHSSSSTPDEKTGNNNSFIVRPSTKVQSGNMSQDAIDAEVEAFLAENSERKQLVKDECRRFRANSSSGYQHLVARTMAGRHTDCLVN